MNGHVACRQLGFSTGRIISIRDGLFKSKAAGSVWLDGMPRCRGNESRLWDCPLEFNSGWQDEAYTGDVIVDRTHAPNDCTLGDDIGLMCDPATFQLPAVSAAAAPPPPLRIAGPTDASFGALEIFSAAENIWGSICDEANTWSVESATVACRQLGFSHGRPVPRVSNTYDAPYRISWIANVTCNGNETSLVPSCKFDVAPVGLKCRVMAGVVCYQGPYYTTAAGG